MSRALERNYDGIIIGAGHHGLVLGSYLARAGLKILLVERRLENRGNPEALEDAMRAALQGPPEACPTRPAISADRP